VLAVWLLAHPASIPTDDAFFFVKGVEHFSVLEFRPHFPGYPGFIALGKLGVFLGGEAQQAVFFLSALSVLSLPPLAAWAAKSNGASQLGALLIFAVTLTQPFLPLVGLSMMSDGTGIAFLLAAFAFWGLGRNGWGGVMAGMALACRPSFLVPVVLAVGAVWFLQKDRQGKLMIGFLGTLGVFFGVVVTLEGVSYFLEGVRFVEGHFMTWGNTALAEDIQRGGWLDSFTREPIAFGCFVALSIISVWSGVRRLEYTPLALAAIGSLLWTLLAQNPENLRHVLLPAVLLSLLMVIQVTKKEAFSLATLILVQASILIPVVLTPVKTSPMEEVIDVLQNYPAGLVISNRGVAYLRSSLNQHRISDAFYKQSTIHLADEFVDGSVWRLIASPGSPKHSSIKAQSFGGRVPGEMSLWLLAQ